MTVIPEGIWNCTDDLVNFVKMQMIGKVPRVLTHCRRQPYFLSFLHKPQKEGMSLSNPPRCILQYVQNPLLDQTAYIAF